MDLELADKVAVVTGASKGIGMAVTRALADEGALVVAGARNPKDLEGIDRVTAVAVDLSAADGPAQLVQRALDDHGRVDVLVNNVGGVKIRPPAASPPRRRSRRWSCSSRRHGLRTSPARTT